ncbi:FtsW/RodA/SpoVE family cell cycle protein [Crocinitomicaceae bacterium]|nr:FtsW/RodA/SpoVE family cell cycle protein [Crocinitomicaceae bacterium]
MSNLLSRLKGDRVIWIITLLMLAFSLVSVYSFVPILVKIEGGTPFKYLFKHFIYVIIGLGVMFWVHRRDPVYFSKLAKFGFYLAIGLLLFTFFFGVRVNDAGRWVRIPFVGLTFQSSDFAKLALIVYVSRILVKKKEVMNDWREGFLPLVTPIVVICALIVKDNFSTAAILFAICLAIMFIAKVPFLKVAGLIGGGVALFMFIVLIQKAAPDLRILPRLETWENRLFNHANNDENIIENAQVQNSMDGIYNGGVDWDWKSKNFSLFGGQGIGDGQLKEYTPEAYADFYYASYVEELGPIAAGILIMLYLILLYRIMRIGLNSKKLFESYVCLGIGILILSQAAVNMLVCTGMFPVTGQNMPLLAMGGSAMIMTCLALGVVQSIAYNQQKENGESDEILEEDNAVFETE